MMRLEKKDIMLDLYLYVVEVNTNQHTDIYGDMQIKRKEQRTMGEEIKNDLVGIAITHPFFNDIVTSVLTYIEELEVEKEQYKNDYFNLYEQNKQYIHYLKIEELAEKIHNELDKNGITRAYQIIIDGYFDEVLGG